MAADGNPYCAVSMRRNDHRPCRTITVSLIILPASFHCSFCHCHGNVQFEEIG